LLPLAFQRARQLRYTGADARVLQPRFRTQHSLESLKPQTCGQQIKFSAASLPSGFKDSTERGAGGEGEKGAERFMKLKASIGLRRASLAGYPVDAAFPSDPPRLMTTLTCDGFRQILLNTRECYLTHKQLMEKYLNA
jgi:hypothetical protein